MSGEAENTIDYIDTQVSRQRSNEIGQLVAALAVAQAQFQPLFKETENPFFKSKYADLSQVIAATRKPLADNGLVIIQTPIVRDKNAGVVSILAHKSGEWIQEELLLPAGVAKFDAQTIGSAITYARRYSYQALIGVAAEVDDDANHATGNNGSKEAAQAVAQRKIAEHNAKSSAVAEGATEHKASGEAVALKKVYFDNRGEWTYLTGDGMGTLLHFLGLPAEEGGIFQFKEKFMAHDMDDMGFPKDWRVKSNKVDILAEACVSYGLEAKQAAKVAQIASNSVPGPSSEAMATMVAPIISDLRLVTKGVTNPFLGLKWGDLECSCFDTALFDHLERGKGLPADLIVKQNKKNGKVYTNIVGIKKIGDTTFTDNVPDLQQERR